MARPYQKRQFSPGMKLRPSFCIGVILIASWLSVSSAPIASAQAPDGGPSSETGSTGDSLRGPIFGDKSGPPTEPPKLPPQGPELLPTDTIPLGVDEFENQLKPLQIKGPLGSFVRVVHDLTFNKPCNNCVGVQIKVQNLSPNPIIVDGEHAQAIGAAAPLRAVSEDAAMASSGSTFTKEQKQLLAAVGLGTLGLAEPILQDHFSTSKTDFPVSYGVNETRRRLEDRRFSRRIILPGEDTTGIIFFPGDTVSFNKISIPIKTYPLNLPLGYLDIQGIAEQGTAHRPEPAPAGQDIMDVPPQAVPDTGIRLPPTRVRDVAPKQRKKKSAAY